MIRLLLKILCREKNKGVLNFYWKWWRLSLSHAWTFKCLKIINKFFSSFIMIVFAMILKDVFSHECVWTDLNLRVKLSIICVASWNGLAWDFFFYFEFRLSCYYFTATANNIQPNTTALRFAASVSLFGMIRVNFPMDSVRRLFNIIILCSFITVHFFFFLIWH